MSAVKDLAIQELNAAESFEVSYRDAMSYLGEITPAERRRSWRSAKTLELIDPDKGRGELYHDDSDPARCDCAVCLEGRPGPWEEEPEVIYDRLCEPVYRLDDCTGAGPECPSGGGECAFCGVFDCPEADFLHYHHDGCPSCGSRE